MIKLIILLTALVGGLSSTYIFKLKHDNHIEEIAEKVIKEACDIEVDLTPSSQEGERNGN